MLALQGAPGTGRSQPIRAIAAAIARATVIFIANHYEGQLPLYGAAIQQLDWLFHENAFELG